MTDHLRRSRAPEMVPLALAGWHSHLDHLADALGGRPVEWSRWGEAHRPRWGELHEGYAASPRARRR